MLKLQHPATLIFAFLITTQMRLKSTTLGMWLLPPSILGYAWMSQQRVHISAICIMLFLCGFFSMLVPSVSISRHSWLTSNILPTRWIYTSTLAYIVDANTGRSSTAVAANSSFRGSFAFMAIEIAVPLTSAVGDGWTSTIWGAMIVISELLMLLVICKGGKWREEEEKREARDAHNT